MPFHAFANIEDNDLPNVPNTCLEIWWENLKLGGSHMRSLAIGFFLGVYTAMPNNEDRELALMLLNVAHMIEMERDKEERCQMSMS